MNPGLFQLPVLLDALVALLVITGAFFALIGSWGLARFSDFLKRLHGPTKATTLGVGSVLIASAIWFSYTRQSLSLHELLITLFLFMTAPVSAHLLIKAALKVDASSHTVPPPQPSGSDASYRD